MIDILYQSQLLFQYDSHEEALHCPYCHLIYNFNNYQVKSSFLDKLQLTQVRIELPNLIFRCIKCALKNEEYLFKLNDEECHFTPNQEQTDVIIELYQQMLITCQSNYTNYLFLLEGQAGTGKTSTIMYLFKYPEFNRFKICFSSQTNKALNVMMEKLDNKYEENISLHEETDGDEENNRSFLTIFKLTDSKTTINSLGETLFEYQENADMRFKYDIIVIDEVSMIEKKQLETILMSVMKMKKEEFMGVCVPTIIFMGDICQLPPVSEDSSIIFENKIQKQYDIHKMTLTTIMRSRNRLTDLSHNVRQLIPLSIDQLIEHDFPSLDLKKFSCQQIKYFSNKTQWLNQYMDIFNKNLSNTQTNRNNGAPIILVYTNTECDSLNTECRNLIFNNPDEQFVKGELLVFKNYYCLKRQKFITGSSNKTIYYVKFFTSEPLIVESVVRTNHTIEAFNFTQDIFGPIIGSNYDQWLQKKISHQQLDYVSSEFKNILDQWTIDVNNKISTNNPIIDIQLNKITKLINQLNHTFVINQLSFDGSTKLDPQDVTPTEIYITSISDQSINQYTDNCDKIKTIIKIHYQSLMFSYKNHKVMKLLIDYLFQKIWKMYFYRLYIWPFANITYGYTITTHRGQGSTYENTFVNISNILGCQKVNAVVRSKSLYTAMTRASSTINLLYQSQTLVPMISTNQFKCHLCNQSFDIKMFPSVNCTIDKICAEKLLSRVKSMYLYIRDEYVILSDKNKNVYQIANTELIDKHINDAYNYVIEHDLLRSEIYRFQYSNLMLIKKLLKDTF